MSKFKVFLFLFFVLSSMAVVGLVRPDKAVAISNIFPSAGGSLVVEHADAVSVPNAQLKWFIGRNDPINPNIALRGFCAPGNSRAYMQVNVFNETTRGWDSAGARMSNFNAADHVNLCVGDDLIVNGVANNNFRIQRDENGVDRYPGYDVLLVSIHLYDQVTLGGLTKFIPEVNTRYITQAELPEQYTRSDTTSLNDGSFAILGNGNNAYGYNTEFSFRPSCKYFTDYDAADGVTDGRASGYLHWRDADGWASYGSQTRWELIDNTLGGAVVASFGPGSAMGPNSNEHVVAPVIFERNHSYTWRWVNINHVNVVHIYMPFPELDTASSNCSDDPPPQPTVACSSAATVYVGQSVVFTGSSTNASGPYTWSGGLPSNGSASGPDNMYYTTSWDSVGNGHYVDIWRSGAWNRCFINVLPPPNGPPTGNVQLTCEIQNLTGNATIRIRRGTISDPDNNVMFLNSGTLTGGDGATRYIDADGGTPGNQSQYFGNNWDIIWSFSVSRSANLYSFSGTVNDEHGAALTGGVSGTVLCPLPPPVCGDGAVGQVCCPDGSLAPSLAQCGGGGDTPADNLGIVANCTTFTFNLNDNEGFTYTVYLQEDNDLGGPGGFTNEDSMQLTADASNNFSAWVESHRDFSTHRFRLHVVNNTFPSEPSTTRTTASFDVGRCLEMACEDLVTNPVAIEINRPFNITSVSFNSRRVGSTTNIGIGQRGNPISYNVNVTVPGTSGGPSNPVANGTFQYNTAAVPHRISHAVAGAYTPTNTPTNSATTYALDSTNNNADVNCGETLRFSSYPYIQSFRGDVIAGYGVKNTAGECTTADSRIRANGNTALDGSGLVGSGTQMAVFARDEVTGFRSAITQTSPNVNNQPWVRIFANAGVTATSANWGGDFDASLCAEDWFSDMAQYPVTAAQGDLSATSGTVRYDVGGGSVALNASSDLTGYRRVFVEGDVVLGQSSTGNAIRYSAGPWNNVTDIPTLVIVATGDVFIHSNLRLIDGIIVSAGTIYTCADSATATFTNGNNGVGRPCYTNPLTVNGALIAGNVELWRTGGTISRRLNPDGNATPAQGYADGLTGAETFRLPPEFYLAPRYSESALNGDQGEKQFDSLISLPPPF